MTPFLLTLAATIFAMFGAAAVDSHRDWKDENKPNVYLRGIR